MSLDATRHAWSIAGLKSAQKLVLLSLADRADEDGQCWPSIARLCRDTGFCRATLFLHIKALIEQNIIQKIGHKNRANLYQILNIPAREYKDLPSVSSAKYQTIQDLNSNKNQTIQPSSSAKSQTIQGKTSSTKSQTSSSTKNQTLIYHLTDQLIKKESKKKKSGEGGREFEAWYSLYPNKKNRQGAIREWQKLKPDKDVQVLMHEGLQREIAWRQKNHGGGTFIPEWVHPERWIKYRRWEDDHGVVTQGRAEACQLSPVEQSKIERAQKIKTLEDTVRAADRMIGNLKDEKLKAPWVAQKEKVLGEIEKLKIENSDG